VFALLAQPQGGNATGVRLLTEDEDTKRAVARLRDFTGADGDPVGEGVWRWTLTTKRGEVYVTLILLKQPRFHCTSATTENLEQVLTVLTEMDTWRRHTRKGE